MWDGNDQMQDADALWYDWRRYAVVNWIATGSSGDGTSRACSRKRAFAQLAEAVLFATQLDSEHRQMARIDCGGKTYQLADIGRLIERSDYPLLQRLSVS